MYIGGVHVFWLGGVLCFIFSFDVFIFLFLDIFFVSLKHCCDEIMIVDDSMVIHFDVSLSNCLFL